MSKYRALYKCRLCGEVFESEDAAKQARAIAKFNWGEGYTDENSEDDEFFHVLCKDEDFAVAVHLCKDGRMGAGDFVGVQEAE